MLNQSWDKSKNYVLPDGKWSWIVVLGNLVIGFTTLGFFRVLPLFCRSLMLEYDVGYAHAASVMGLFALGDALGGFVLPVLTRKFGSRKICLVAGFFQAFSNTISSQVNSFLVMQICTGFVTGFTTAILYFTMMSSSSRYFIKHRAKATGISTLGIPLGTLILAPATDRLISIYGWRGALLILSGILLNSCVSASLYRPLQIPQYAVHKKSIAVTATPPANVTQTNSDTLERGTTKPERRLSRRQSIANFAQDKMRLLVEYHVFKSISFDIAMISSVFFFCGYVGGNTFIVPMARDYTGLDSFQASTMLSMVGAAECIAKILTGFVADFKRVNKCILVAATSVMGAFCLIAMTLCQSYWSLAVACFLYGFFVTAYVGIIIVIFCEIVGTKYIAAAVGYQGCIYNCFLSLSLFLMGRLLDATGDPRWVFYISSCLIIAAAICLLIVYFLLKRSVGILAQ